MAANVGSVVRRRHVPRRLIVSVSTVAAVVGCGPSAAGNEVRRESVIEVTEELHDVIGEEFDPDKIAFNVCFGPLGGETDARAARTGGEVEGDYDESVLDEIVERLDPPGNIADLPGAAPGSVRQLSFDVLSRGGLLDVSVAVFANGNLYYSVRSDC